MKTDAYSVPSTKVPTRSCRSLSQRRKPRKESHTIRENASRPAECRLVCPDCHSESLNIKRLRGWERLMVFLTDRRKYRCKDCNLGFRAQDRRRYPRDEGALLQSAWAAHLLGRE